MDTRARSHTHAQTHTYTNIHIHKHKHTQTQTHTYTYIHIHVRTHTHTHTNIRQGDSVNIKLHYTLYFQTLLFSLHNNASLSTLLMNPTVLSLRS